MLSCWRKQRPSLVAAVPLRVIDGIVEVEVPTTELMLQHEVGFKMVARFFELDPNCFLTLHKLNVLRDHDQLAKATWDFSFEQTLNISVDNSEEPRCEAPGVVGGEKPSSLFKEILKGFDSIFKPKQQRSGGSDVSDINSDCASDVSVIDILLPTKKVAKRVISCCGPGLGKRVSTLWFPIMGQCRLDTTCS